MISRLRFTSICMLLLVACTVPSFGRVQSIARRTADGSNLRQIGQASLIFAQDNHDQLPDAADVWDYARLLAESAGLEDGAMWRSKIDPASDDDRPYSLRILLPDDKVSARRINPDFREIKPSVAVALGKINTTHPATTPIAWTRGLQPDGTWAAHSPYGTQGGYIMFLGGNISFFKNLGNVEGGAELMRFDGKGTTANILESLPPGVRIGEYLPTPEEQARWSSQTRDDQRRETLARYTPLILIALLWLPFIGISIHRFRRGLPGAITVLLWPLLLMFLLAIIVPTC
jgi:hypothetical protein